MSAGINREFSCLIVWPQSARLCYFATADCHDYIAALTMAVEVEDSFSVPGINPPQVES